MDAQPSVPRRAAPPAEPFDDVHIPQSPNFNLSILDHVLPSIDEAHRPSKEALQQAQNHTPRRTLGELERNLAIFNNIERAERSFEAIARLCKARPPGPSGDELAERLTPYFEMFVGWVDVFCAVGYIHGPAGLLYELWKLPTFATKFRDSRSNIMKSLLLLWISKDSRTRSHTFPRPNISTLINLFLGLTLDGQSKTSILAALDTESSEGITTIAQAFHLRMKEIVELHADGKIGCEFALKYLAKLAEILDRLLPGDTRHYRSRFLCEERLLSSFYGSVSLIMPTYTSNTNWSIAAVALKYLSRFIFEAGEYSGSPISMLVEVISGGGITFLLGCIYNLTPATPKHDLAIHFMNKIAPCFMYREVWKAAQDQFPSDRVELLPSHVFDRLSAHSSLAGTTWTSLQVAFHDADAVHTGRARKVLTRGCDNENHDNHPSSSRSEKCSRCKSVVYCSEMCQREDWERRHRQECPLLTSRYRTRDSNQWLSIKTKADILAFVENYFNSQFHLFEAAASQLDRPWVRPFIARLNITSHPFSIRVWAPSAYTLPECEDPVFMDRAKSFVERFGQKPAHQLLEISFSYGKEGHIAIVHMRGTRDGKKKVKGSVFGVKA